MLGYITSTTSKKGIFLSLTIEMLLK